MTKSQQIRESVSQTYGRLVSSSSSTSCCGPAPKGTLARVAGYGREELGAIPEEAVTNSFGCGNPLAFSDVRPGDVVLDLGCGAGIDVMLAAKKVGPRGRVIGVDMTDEMIAKARALVAEAGLSQVEIRKGLIEDLPVESASVDWVISNCVINLSPEKPRVFAEIARVLKPGGRMIVSDIIAEGLPQSVKEDLALHSSCVAGAMSEADYRSGLQQAGMVDVEIGRRYEFEPSQLEALSESDERASARTEDWACCMDAGADQSTLAASCAGKVWSAEILARKPM